MLRYCEVQQIIYKLSEPHLSCCRVNQPQEAKAASEALSRNADAVEDASNAAQVLRRSAFIGYTNYYMLLVMLRGTNPHST